MQRALKMIAYHAAVIVFVTEPIVCVAQHIQAPGTPATGPYTHAESGMVFPVEVAGFKRFRLTHGVGAEDINAGYAYVGRDLRLSATLFVERHAPKDGKTFCESMVEFEKQRLPKQYADAVIADLTPAAMPGYTALGFSSRYTNKGAPTRQASYYYCRDGSDWTMLYLFTHLTDADASALEAAFLRDLKPMDGPKP
jgi:hypothetical protein